MEQNFIKTTDVSTAEKLSSLGFQRIDIANGIYTFLNSGKIQFSNDEIDKRKIQYSNMLSI